VWCNGGRDDGVERRRSEYIYPLADYNDVQRSWTMTAEFK
jgi:hypothetical protein